jgi:hypothetical protein
MRRIWLAVILTVAITTLLAGPLLAQEIDRDFGDLGRDNYGRGFRVGAASPAGCSIDKSRDSDDNHNYSDKDSSVYYHANVDQDTDKTTAAPMSS